MVQVTVAHRSPLIAAAVSITALGILSLPAPAQARPTFPLAPACTQYVFIGDYALKQGNGARVEFTSNGPNATGRAHATGTGGGGGEMFGNVSGGIRGSSVDFRIQWDSGPRGHYTGSVPESGFAYGFTIDEENPDSSATWDATVPLGCSTPAPAPPPPPPPPPPVQAPPQAPPAPAAKTAEVASDVDVYDAPGGNGKVLGILRSEPAPQKVEVVGNCKANDWCQVTGPNVPTGKGFVWGSLKL